MSTLAANASIAAARISATPFATLPAAALREREDTSSEEKKMLTHVVHCVNYEHAEHKL